jgi:hypothetical protein
MESRGYVEAKQRKNNWEKCCRYPVKSVTLQANPCRLVEGE